MSLTPSQVKQLKKMIADKNKTERYPYPPTPRKPKKVLPKRKAMIKPIMCSHCPELTKRQTQLGTIYVTKFSHLSRLDLRCFVCHEFTTLSQEMLE